MSLRRRIERQRLAAWRRRFEKLTPVEQLVLMHFPEMDRSSEEAWDKSLCCEMCVDFRAAVCPGEGLGGYCQVVACMEQKCCESGNFGERIGEREVQ